ncbi:ABC transporter permease [Weissella kandleri]|uniref:ABC transporter permease n=1 Tax=Weissella kandleri TaxID=1616 RepID=UPI00387E2858
MFLKQLLLVAKQTFKVRVKTIGYWSLVLSPILIAGVIFMFGLLFNTLSSHPTPVVGVRVDSGLEQRLMHSQTIKAKYRLVDSEKQGLKLLHQQKIDSLLTQAGTTYLVQNTPKGHPVDADQLQTFLKQYTIEQKAQEMHLSSVELQALMAPPTTKTRLVSVKGESAGDDAAKQAQYMLTVGLGIFIFIFLSTYVGMIATEIANEKSSRIMEILLAATSPAVQFFGKLLGIIGLALLHLGLYAAILLLSWQFIPANNRYVLMFKDILKGVDLNFVVTTLLMVFLGIVLYLILTAIIAAMINDQSQVQQAVSPVTYLAMGGYILTFMVSSTSENMVIKVLSYLPFLSQTLMPARVGLQLTQPYDVWLAIGFQIVMIYFLGRYGLRVYRDNVLRYSEGNLTWESLKSLGKIIHYQKNSQA